MASLFRVQFGVVQRAKGDNALMRLAYQSCARVKRPDGSGTFDFRRKRAEHAETVLMLPADAPTWAQDGAEIWRRAEATETRKNAQVARTGEITIPRQVPPELRADFVRAACAPLVAEGMAVQADLHNPAALDGQEQPHAHLMVTMRRFDASSTTGFESKKALDWNGLFAEFSGGKVKGDKQAVRDMRQAMADAMNRFCAEHHIDYIANAGRAADREPEPQIPAWKFEAHRAGRPQAEIIDLTEYRAARAEAEAANTAAAELAAELAALPPEVPHVSIAAADDQAQDRRTAFRRRMTTADDRRRNGKAAALREAYELDGWLPADAVRNIDRIGLDRQSGAVHILLTDGTRIRDDGARVALAGTLTETAAAELVAAAQRRGWTSVELTGPRAFKDAMAARLALAEPPVAVVGHELPAAAQAQIAAELARRAVDRQPPPAPPPPRPEAAAAAWLRSRAADRRRSADELDHDRRTVVEHGGRFDRPTSDALFALDRAEKALAGHRATGRPAGVLDRLTGRSEAWDEEERRLEDARAHAEAELDRLRDEKRRAHERATDEARPLQRQADQHRHQAAALDKVAAAAKRGDPRACAVAARQDEAAALRLAETLRRETEAATRQQQAAQIARQQPPGTGPAEPAPRFGKR